MEIFDGPLDLLLHLLAKNKVEIKDIPISEILEQYLEYINAMQEFDLEVASDFVAMAAQLMYIKSKMLLPVHQEDEQEDPREQLVQALLDYQRFKEAGGMFGDMSEAGKDIFVKPPEIVQRDKSQVVYEYTPEALSRAISAIFERAQRKMPPPVTAFRGIVGHEVVPVSDKIGQLIHMFSKSDTVDFDTAVLSCKSRSEVVALFLAVLELSKTRKILIEDNENKYTLVLVPGQTEVKDGTI